MPFSQRFVEAFAALLGFLGVLLGAIAAHHAQNPYGAELLQKASLYQLAHSVAILALVQRQDKPARIACAIFGLGIILFCGGLALKALAEISTGPAIPVGGSLLMLGWLVLFFPPLFRKG